MPTIALAGTLLMLAACSVDSGGLEDVPGTGSGAAEGLGGAVAKGLAPYASVDLVTGEVAFAASRPDLDDPRWTTSHMLFRRIINQDGEFFMAIYEVTQAQWQALANTSPWQEVPSAVCSADAWDGRKPAYNLDANAVKAAIATVVLSGDAYLALPTSAEWQNACGADEGWWWSDQPMADKLVARHAVATSVRLQDGGGMDAGGPRSVGSCLANPSGLYDMLGNIWELCDDGELVRGGSWFDPAGLCRADLAVALDIGLDHGLVGARLVMHP